MTALRARDISERSAPPVIDASEARRIPYMPALDGLRAVALCTVLAFHGGFEIVHGGYLPLTSFFVLSGFLITALLLAERTRSGGTDLRRFWVRRFRRLVPAAVLGIGLAILYVQLAGDRVAATVQGDGFAALFWFANWRFIATGQTYADAFSDPSPFQHFWSLAVEEQFYLVLPVLFVAGFALGRGRRRLFAGTIVALTVASVIWMAHLHQPGDAPLRTYFGTDTRGAELLVGVLLALVLVDRSGRLRRFDRRTRRVVDVAGAMALAASVVSWFVTREYDDRLYEGGLLGVALLAAVVVTAGTQPDSMVTRVLSLRPLVWLGRLSYGVYLFHWPIFLYLDPGRTGLDTVPLFALRMAVTLALAWVSFRFVEEPLRTGAAPRFVMPIGWASATVGTAACLVAFAAIATPAITLTAGPREGELPPPPPVTVPANTSTTTAPTATTADPDAAGATPGEDAGASPTTVAGDPADGDRTGTGGRNAAPGVTPSTPTGPPATSPAPTAPPPPPPVRIMVMGDSIAKNLATGLDRWARNGAPVVVYDVSYNGCPISRGGALHTNLGTSNVRAECGWWSTATFDQRIAEFAPDIIIVHAGPNDFYDRSHPSLDGIRSPGDVDFDRFLTSEWDAATRRFRATGATVLWATAPCVDTASTGLIDDETANTRIRYANNNYVPKVRAAGARIVDFGSHLCPGGSFTTTIDGVSDARPDGYHLSDTAAEAVATRWLGPIVLGAAGR